MAINPRIRKSANLFEEAKKYIPGGAQLSRCPELFIPGEYPLYIEETYGCRFKDIDGNEYIDYLAAYGPIVLGYAYPQVNDAVRGVIDKATVVSMSHPVHVELAKELVRIVPCAEMVYFRKTGSCATSTAVKIARVYSGKDKVVRYGYSGWHDWTCGAAWWSDFASGSPEVLKDYILDMPYNDLEALEKLLKDNVEDVACVIMEPVKLEPPEPGFLQGVKDLCRKYNIILIFDEIKTGFRFSLGGAQEYFGVTPDLTTLSKGMANGFPIAAVVGKKEIMAVAQNISLSATFDGEVTAMAAALTTIKEIEKNKVNDHIWAMGRKFMDGLDNLAQQAGIEAKSVGMAPMPYLEFTSRDELDNYIAKEAFFTEAIERGVFLAPNHLWYITFGHKEKDIEQTLEICKIAFETAKQKLTDKKIREIAAEKVKNVVSRFPTKAK